MSTVPVQEAATRLAELIDAAVNGEDVVITGDDRIAVRLAPVEPAHRPRFGSATGTFTMADDFDAPLDDFRSFER